MALLKLSRAANRQQQQIPSARRPPQFSQREQMQSMRRVYIAVSDSSVMAR
jgi:hypothetical protein